MVQEMLDQYRIQPSNNPFSSPILFVKNKDGRWRVFTDYQALNAITVKGSFHMPRLGALLDELNGAQYFLKLGLRSGHHLITVKTDDRVKTLPFTPA